MTMVAIGAILLAVVVAAWVSAATARRRERLVEEAVVRVGDQVASSERLLVEAEYMALHLTSQLERLGDLSGLPVVHSPKPSDSFASAKHERQATWNSLTGKPPGAASSQPMLGLPAAWQAHHQRTWYSSELEVVGGSRALIWAAGEEFGRPAWCIDEVSSPDMSDSSLYAYSGELEWAEVGRLLRLVRSGGRAHSPIGQDI